MTLICLLIGHNYQFIEAGKTGNLDSYVKVYCKRCGKYSKNIIE